MNKSEEVILVDSDDRELGVMDKLEAHRQGVLHRAFSIFIFNSRGEMLIHRRAANKYHTASLWSNACCSHPRPGEAMQSALRRKLSQEMGITCDLSRAFTFLYRSELGNGLIEYELDHIYVGLYDGLPDPNPDEVADWRYADTVELAREMELFPDRFTPWFRLLFEPLTAHYFEFKRA